MKKCPFCAEEIQEEAVKCRHCGEFLIDAELRKIKKASGVEWYYSTWMVILWILILGPFAMPFILKNPQYDTSKKVLWTTVTIVYTILMVLLMVALIIVYFWFMKRVSNFGL
jgi:predicted nucleic acid-binding Zn ribbon protein